MYKCNKCICLNCKKYFDNGGECDYCLMCTASITNNELFKKCDDFISIKNKEEINE